MIRKFDAIMLESSVTRNLMVVQLEFTAQELSKNVPSGLTNFCLDILQIPKSRSY